MKKIIILSAMVLAGIAARAQNADPLVNILMDPPAVQVATNGLLRVDVINAGTDTIVKNSLEVTIGMSSNGEILGVATGSSPAWTVQSLSTGTANTIKLRNTANGIGEDSLQQIILTVRGNVISGPATVTGNIVYIATGNADLGGAPNAVQGNLSSSNDNSTTSLTVTAGTPLPLGLGSFTGTMASCQASLSWSVSSARSYTGFVVEQSSDGRNFSPIATINAGDNKTSYSYSGRQNVSRSFYRLKLTDPSGNASYSNTVSLAADCMLSEASLSPNPTRGAVRLTGLIDGGAVRVYNQVGAIVVQQQQQSADPGLVDLSKLPAGLYRISWETEAGVVTRSVTKL